MMLQPPGGPILTSSFLTLTLHAEEVSSSVNGQALLICC